MNENQIAWITGAGRGIGEAIAKALASEGYDVAISSRTTDELERVAAELRTLGCRVCVAVCDVSDEGSVKTAYEKIVAELGEPTLLVNNAGISPWSTFTETSLKEFDRTIAINLRGAFLCSKIALPAMYRSGQGAVVQILSVAAARAYKNGATYVASKFGALGFTNALREEARKHGVRVISVLPGAVETELWDRQERERSGHKMMQPVDIASMIVAALHEPARALVEEISIRPIGGDI
jgi:3-oxoacyl-[acyl-carrier protein] reductase